MVAVFAAATPFIFWSLETVVAVIEDGEMELALGAMVLDATAAIVAAMLLLELIMVWETFPFGFSGLESQEELDPFSLLLRLSLYYTHICFNFLKYVRESQLDRLYQVEKSWT